MIRLTNEDNLELMARYPDKYFDLAIVDPPYRDNNQPTREMRKKGHINAIAGRPGPDYYEELKRVSKHQIIFGANNFDFDPYKGFIVWDKKKPLNFTLSMAEIASISEGLGTTSKIFKYRVVGGEKKIHPTQKPIALYEWILQRYAREGWKILDTHGGSMSIACACYALGFDLTLCELDKTHYLDGLRRFKNYTLQTIAFNSYQEISTKKISIIGLQNET